MGFSPTINVFEVLKRTVVLRMIIKLNAKSYISKEEVYEKSEM